MIRVPNILFLTGDEKEARSLQELLGGYAYLAQARNLSEMNLRLEQYSFDVLFCAWDFYQGAWNSELQEIQDFHPGLPVVVISRDGGEREWLEVLEAGESDLLGFPCQQSTLIGVVEQAIVTHEARKARRFTIVM